MQYLFDNPRLLFVLLSLAVVTGFTALMALVYWAAGKARARRSPGREDQRQAPCLQAVSACGQQGDVCRSVRECA